MQNLTRRVSLLLLGALCFAAGTAGGDITASERQQALHYLEETRQGVQDAVKGLSDAQLRFKPGSDRWSVAECLEHIALVEGYVVQNVFGEFSKAPEPAPGRDAKQVDEMILAKLPDRSQKFQAPEPLLPAARWTPAAALQHFLDSRAETIAFLNRAHDLRAHVVTHPAFGPLDGYQWILGIAGHSARHTQQILEVKADPRFPVK
jgi:uncharacterized damage-inducible protein DinB